jgi:hypothetical protein
LLEQFEVSKRIALLAFGESLVSRSF